MSGVFYFLSIFAFDELRFLCVDQDCVDFFDSILMNIKQPQSPQGNNKLKKSLRSMNCVSFASTTIALNQSSRNWTFISEGINQQKNKTRNSQKSVRDSKPFRNFLTCNITVNQNNSAHSSHSK